MVTATLIAATGARRVSREELNAFSVPLPMGRCHAIVPHGELVNTVEGNLASAGFIIRDSQFCVQRGHNQMFSVFTLASPVSKNDVLAVGLRSSYDQSLKLSLCAGVRTLVCSNLCFNGSLINVHRKHSVGVVQRGTFYHEVQAAIQLQLPAFKEAQETRIKALSEAGLSESQAFALIVTAVRKGVINSKYVLDVSNEFVRPSHDYGDLATPSMYTLMQAFTTALGKSAERNPIEYANKTMKLARLLSPAEYTVTNAV